MNKNAAQEAKSSSVNALHGVGRRKKSVARVWLKRNGNGKIVVNGKDYTDHFVTDIAQAAVALPLGLCKYDDKFDVQVNVVGGGIIGQAEATRLGIARALLSFDENLRTTLREHDLLTVDARVKERKKYGQRGARRKFQFVKR